MSQSNGVDTTNELIVFGYTHLYQQCIVIPFMLIMLILQFYHIDEQWEFTQDKIMQLNNNNKQLIRTWSRSKPKPLLRFGRRRARAAMSAPKGSKFDNTAYGKCVIDSTIPASIIWKLKWKIKWHQDFAVGIASVPSNPPPTNICFAFDELNDNNIKWYSFRNHNSQTFFECHNMQWNRQIDGNNDGAFWENDDILILTLKLTEIAEKSTLSFGRERNGKVQ